MFVAMQVIGYFNTAVQFYPINLFAIFIWLAISSCLYLPSNLSLFCGKNHAWLRVFHSSTRPGQWQRRRQSIGRRCSDVQMLLPIFYRQKANWNYLMGNNVFICMVFSVICIDFIVFTSSILTKISATTRRVGVVSSSPLFSSPSSRARKKFPYSPLPALPFSTCRAL